MCSPMECLLLVGYIQYCCWLRRDAAYVEVVGMVSNVRWDICNQGAISAKRFSERMYTCTRVYLQIDSSLQRFYYFNSADIPM